MPAYLLTAPAAEPLSLAEAKQVLRVEHADDDDLIGALIRGARGHVEAATRRALITQTWRHVLDAWPTGGEMAMSPSPLREVLAARVYQSSGATQPLDAGVFAPDLARDRLLFDATAVPAPERTHAGIEIDVRVGYGADADAVPEPLRQAMRLLVAHWYELRGVVASGQGAPLPENIRALIAPFRNLGL